MPIQDLLILVEDLTNGLKFPRDYYNGWGLKWFIENVINHELGYTYEGPSAEIPLVTWGTYHWTDGSVERMDGLLLDCEEDVAPDGLHLSGSGEIKMGQLMLNYFIADTTAKYWFLMKNIQAFTIMIKKIQRSIFFQIRF